MTKTSAPETEYNGSMTAEEFGALAERLQVEAQKHPRAYTYRVFLLALLGYGYIFGALAAALLVSLIHPLVFVVAGLPLAFIVIRALWVRVPAPQGVPIESYEAPRLFRTVGYIRDILKFPGFDRILAVDDFNAGINQIPRLGALGWHRNYLLLGLPLLMGVSPEQFRAVLAHEFYHLFGTHNRFERWLARIRTTWNNLMDDLERRRHRGAFFFRRFFRWYVPLLNAHTFVLARQHEYEADQFAADLIGARAMADALVTLKVKGAFLVEAFWPQVWERADHLAEPPENPYAQMRLVLRKDLNSLQAQEWLDRALAERTATEDSHPALADRLAALGQPPRLPEGLAETAAEHYLGASLEAFSKILGRDWNQQATAAWRARYGRVEAARKELAALEEKARSEALAESEACQRASCTELLHGAEAAWPLYRQCLERYPDSAECHHAVGRLLLAEKNPAGIEHIERAMRVEPDYILEGCDLLYVYLKAEGRGEEAAACAQRFRRRHELLQAAENQRTVLHARDRFFTHDLPEEEVAGVRERLARCRAVAAACLVRKQVTLLPEKPHYVLGIIWRFWYPIWSEQRLLLRLAQEIRVSRGSMSFVALRYGTRLRLRVTSVPGSRIYRRPWFGGGKEHPDKH